MKLISIDSDEAGAVSRANTCRRTGRLLWVTILALVVAVPAASPQFPPAVTGSTLGTNLRNAAAATQTQAEVVRRTADDWGRRVGSASYGIGFFQQDFVTLQMQFGVLRDRFNWTSSLAMQLGRPRAANAVAELDAGLNIISELFAFLSNQANAGALDRQTIARTCRAFEDAIQEWQREFRRNSSRLGVVW